MSGVSLRRMAETTRRVDLVGWHGPLDPNDPDANSKADVAHGIRSLSGKLSGTKRSVGLAILVPHRRYARGEVEHGGRLAPVSAIRRNRSHNFAPCRANNQMPVPARRRSDQRQSGPPELGGGHPRHRHCQAASTLDSRYDQLGNREHVCLSETARHVGPVDDVPKGGDEICLHVLVLQIKGVFPGVEHQERH